MGLSRRSTAILTSTLAAVTLGAAGITLASTSSAAEEPNTPPSGSHLFSTRSLWTGQTLTLVAEAITDDRTPLAEIDQIVDWGDGSPVQTVAGDVKQISHVYPAIGDFRPRVRLSDGTDTAVAGCYTPCTVNVSMPMGGYKVKQSSAWVGKAAALVYHTSDDADTVRIWWGDQTTSTVRSSLNEATATHVYATAGTFTVSAAPANEAGVATPRNAGKITVRKDTTRPAVTLTRPATATKAKSWAKVRGKSSDVGLGVRGVTLTAIEQRGAAWHYYTGAKWVRAASAAAAATKAKALTVTPAASGAWSLPLKGLAKGTVRFTVTAVDKAGNRSVPQRLTYKITA